jgi:hypothetical protein
MVKNLHKILELRYKIKVGGEPTLSFSPPPPEKKGRRLPIFIVGGKNG